MSTWPSSKARVVLAALTRIGWRIKRQSGSHRTLTRDRWADVVFAFHDDEDAQESREGGCQGQELEEQAFRRTSEVTRRPTIALPGVACQREDSAPAK